jgi:hypothetical protein
MPSPTPDLSEILQYIADLESENRKLRTLLAGVQAYHPPGTLEMFLNCEHWVTNTQV